jgi:hypothetical protein
MVCQMTRADKLKLVLTREQAARYYKAKGWFQLHVNNRVSEYADLYILESVLTGRKFKGGELMALGKEPKDSAHVTIDIFERTY